MNTVVSNTRINKFDNLKGLAIFLIVLGHFTLFRSYDSINFIRNFVFLIHIPLFFFVSGYFSKIGANEPIKAFKRLFIPYIIFCIIWEIFNVYFLGDAPKSILFLHPGYMLWFLMSLFFMKMALPIMDNFKYPLIIAIFGSLLIGFIDSNILGISRTFIYMPVFLLGFYYDDYKSKVIDKLPIIKNNKFAIFIFILTLIASILIALYVPYDLICCKHDYSNFWMKDMLIRSIIIFVSTLNVLVITRFMTNDKIILTQWGINSLAVYLLQAYVIKGSKVIVRPLLMGHEKLTVVFVFVISFIIVWILSRDIVTKALNKFFNLTYKILCLE